MAWGNKKSFSSKQWLLKVTMHDKLVDKKLEGFILIPSVSKKQLLVIISEMKSKQHCDIEVIHNFIEIEKSMRSGK